MAKRWVATDFGDLDVFQLQDFDPPEPAAGEVRIAVRAAGMNPADYKHVASAGDRSSLPIPIGYEVSGIIDALGPGTTLASGGGDAGDAVLAYRIAGGYSTHVIAPASDVFAKPESLSDQEAANLLLAGTTAAEMLHVTGVGSGDTVVLHGASGAVGVSVLQQAAQLGVRVIGTASHDNFATVQRFGGEPVEYGEGLRERLSGLALDGYSAALDAVGTDEAIDVSLELVPDRDRIVTIAAFGRAEGDGIKVIGGAMPESKKFRDGIRGRLIDLAADRSLVVPVAKTFPLSDAKQALQFLQGGHPGGKLALIPD